MKAPTIKYTPFYPQKNTQRFSVPPGNLFIQNALIWTVNRADDVIPQGNILITDGIIQSIGAGVQPPDGWDGTRVDAGGRYVTPGSSYNLKFSFASGLVDMHSHLGVYAFPEDSFGTSDGNEASDPTTPQGKFILFFKEKLTLKFVSSMPSTQMILQLILLLWVE